MLVRVGDGSVVKEAVKGILMLVPYPVGNLNARAGLLGIFKEVDIGALTEAMMRRIVGLRAVKVVDVSEA